MADIALIGVGLVGSALAERFVSAGRHIVVHDCRPEALRDFPVAGSAFAAAACAPVVVLSLPDSDVVDRVVAEIEPALTGRTVIDTTTGDPDRTAALGRRLKQRGIDYVDATIAGSSRQVREGIATVMAGGEGDVLRDCETIFRCFASRWFSVGPWGSGARMKLVVNLVLGLNRAALAEGLSFAKAIGIEQNMALDVLSASAAYSRTMDTKGQKMVAGEFSAEARLSQHHKDVQLILGSAKQLGIELPFSRVHDRLLTKLEVRGFGDSDNSAIIRAFDQER